MRKLSILLAGTSMLLSGAAFAQDAPAGPVPAADDGADQNHIVVIGRGETRQVQQLSSSDIAELAAGTSPLKAIEKLPSVNFQSADPFGAYEWATRVSIRSFNQNQLGFTLDGIPLGDASYGNVNGLHISRAITSENIGEVRVSQGAGSLGTQATNNLGGTLEFFSRDPSDQFGIRAEGTYGSANTKRIFGRIESGDIGGGVKAYASYVYSDMDKWKGWGSQRTNQANGKIVAPVADDVRLVGTISYSDRRENDYQDLSLGMLKRLGYKWDNISNDYALAVRVADVANNIDNVNNTTGAPVPDGLSDITGLPPSNPAAGKVFPAPIGSLDDAYFDAAGLRRDWLGSLGVEGESGGLRFALKGYYHNNHGQGLWFTPYVPSPGGTSPISIRTTEYDINRKGVFGHTGGKLGEHNDVTIGFWYERNDFQQARRFYALSSRTAPSRRSLDFQANPFATQWDYDYTTDTFQYYVQDKLTFGDLTLNLGWKGFKVKNAADPNVAGTLARGRIDVTDWFQPTAGFNYRLGAGAELFGGFTQVTRAFVASATSGPFATTQAGFNALLSGSTRLKPEQSDTWELGGRMRSGPFTGSLAGYYVNFRNRLLGVTTGAGIVGNPVTLQNVGDVRAIGFEATGDLRLGSGFGAFVSYSYNDSTYRDDVRNAGGTLLAATKGKTVVDAPKHLLKGELTYDHAGFNARIGANYMSRRYFTYTNDQSIAGRVLVDAMLGYMFDLGGHGLEIQANATNLLDKKYVSTIGTNGFGNSGDNQTLMVGAPQQFFVTLKAGF